MLSERNEGVTVRCLPDGQLRPGELLNVAGTSLQIVFQSNEGAAAPGDLVEVKSLRTLFLGEVRSCRDSILTVEVEHSIDLKTLEVIQRVWQRPAAE